MRWTTLRGLKKLSMQAMLTLVAMNLKEWPTGHGVVQKWPNKVGLRDDFINFN